MSKHTPGPWSVRGGWDRLCVTDTNGAYIVDRFILGGRTDEEHKANARLIAAAPDLLSALRRIIDANDAPLGATIGEAKVCEYYASIAREAIAKAIRDG